MVQLTSIATRGGDLGKTSLGDGKRLYKNHLRIDAIGSVDEVNSFIGLALALGHTEISTDLLAIQNDLFDVGADLCMPELNNIQRLHIIDSYVERMDAYLLKYNSRLSPLTSFVLPGGCMLASYLHVIRTIVRRAERSIVALSLTEDVNPILIRYINRLSDVMFVMARVANDNGKNDVIWCPGGNQ